MPGAYFPGSSMNWKPQDTRTLKAMGVAAATGVAQLDPVTGEVINPEVARQTQALMRNTAIAGALSPLAIWALPASFSIGTTAAGVSAAGLNAAATAGEAISGVNAATVGTPASIGGALKWLYEKASNANMSSLSSLATSAAGTPFAGLATAYGAGIATTLSLDPDTRKYMAWAVPATAAGAGAYGAYRVAKAFLPPPSPYVSAPVYQLDPRVDQLVTAMNSAIQSNLSAKAGDYAIGGQGLLSFRSQPAGSDMLPGPRLTPVDMAAISAIVQRDAMTACTIIMAQDPEPASAAAYMIGSETDNMFLLHPGWHVLMRHALLGGQAVTRGTSHYPVIAAPELPMMRAILDSSGAYYDYHPDEAPSRRLSDLRLRVKKTAYSLIDEMPEYMATGNPEIGGITPYAGYSVYDASREGCSTCGCGQFAFQRDSGDDAAPIGEFFSTPTFRASVKTMEPGIYGETWLDTVPYRVYVNSRNTPDRSLISFVHETLHGFDRLYKLGLDHDKLHQLSVFMTQEAIPGYLKLKQHLNT